MIDDAMPGALHQDDLFALAADQPTAMAALRLTAADVEEQWLMRELRAQIAARRLGLLINVDNPLSCARYMRLRSDVEALVQLAEGLRDDLTKSEAEGEVLHSLWWLLQGQPCCRGCFVDAASYADMHLIADCPVRVAA